MTVIVELRPEVEAGLATQAAEQGLSLEHYVLRLLEGFVPAPAQPALSPAERAAAWRASVRGLPRTPPLSDHAVSRESIYADRG
jgi:hypothetical protein